MDKKFCSLCKEEKLLSEFSKNNTVKSGYKYACKVCLNIKKKEYYKNNKEKVREYRQNNIEKIKEKKKEYRINNKEKIKEKEKEYR